MAITPSMTVANVMHARQRPKQHAFNYSVYYLYFALSELSQVKNCFLSQERFNLMSFYRRDHGARDGSDLTEWMKGVLRDHKLMEADGEIVLLTLPRILGYVFNPVSFWFCLDQAGRLRAVLSEVGNTFGEHHSYISYHEDHRPIDSVDWLRAEKVFHVSPFMDVKGYYQFRFACSAQKVSAVVNYYDEGGLMLATSVVGKPTPLTAFTTLKCFFFYPLVTLKVIGLIHWEAVRIVLKGIRYRPKPIPPAEEVTR